MHPILENRQRLTFYLLAWLPIAALLTVILKRDPASWLEAILVAVPLSLLYAFMCLSAWYVCLTAPMRSQTSARSMGTLGAGAALASGAWALLGEVWALSLGFDSASDYHDASREAFTESLRDDEAMEGMDGME